VRVSIRLVAFVEVTSGASGAADPRENAMSVTTPTAPTVTEPYAVRRASSLRRTTVVAGLVAAALVALHVLAAAIVVPALVRHAHD
jgi:hypothetical protein